MQLSETLFAEYRHPLDLKAGPNRMLAFLVKQANLEHDRYDSNLWLLQDNCLKQLTEDGRVSKYWWMPDGTLLFRSLVSPQERKMAEAGVPLTVLYRLDPNCPEQATEYARLDHVVEELVALPDGRLVFTAEFYNPTDRIMRQAGGDLSKVKELLAIQQQTEQIRELPFWSNGQGYTSGRRNRLWLWDQGLVSCLLDETTHAEQLRLDQTGRLVYFCSQSWNSMGSLYNRLVQLDTTDMRCADLSWEPAFNHSVFVPLKGNQLLVFGNDMKQHGINQNGRFYHLDAGTGKVIPLYQDGEYNGYDAVLSDLKMSCPARWQAVGSLVYWTTTLGETVQLMSIDAETGEICQLTHCEGCIQEFAVLGQQVLYTAMVGQQATEIYQSSFEELGRLGNQLSWLNQRVAQQKFLRQPQPVGFTNRDGVKIAGWGIPPAGLAAGKTAPVILSVHGGPKMTYGTVAFHELQHLASKGFGVLYCNPTGSDGRGDEFADLRKRYGQVDYQDLMGFIKAARQRFEWIDPERIGVMGGSYGGFMVNWMIGQTSLFRAAVSERGISNWVSMALSSDIGQWFVPDQIGASPVRDPAALWEISPLKHAAAVKTPTLFIHSDKDYRCWMGEAIQMYSALKMVGVDTEICLFHDENHDLSRTGKPRNRVKRLQEIVRWFEIYLKGESLV